MNLSSLYTIQDNKSFSAASIEESLVSSIILSFIVAIIVTLNSALGWSIL